MKVQFVIAAILIIVIGIAIAYQDSSVYGEVFSSVFMLAGAFWLGRATKK